MPKRTCTVSDVVTRIIPELSGRISTKIQPLPCVELVSEGQLRGDRRIVPDAGLCCIDRPNRDGRHEWDGHRLILHEAEIDRVVHRIHRDLHVPGNFRVDKREVADDVRVDCQHETRRLRCAIVGVVVKSRSDRVRAVWLQRRQRVTILGARVAEAPDCLEFQPAGVICAGGGHRNILPRAYVSRVCDPADSGDRVDGIGRAAAVNVDPSCNSIQEGMDVLFGYFS